MHVQHDPYSNFIDVTVIKDIILPTITSSIIAKMRTF